ncbi:MAG TPA: pyridoxine 5'-phosphate synthase [Bacteroidota bacterium]|nr:pyridoxine 5'-phosphate synthase [Bacteroidota bacterium]
MRLSVNIDHIATLRNARGGSLPDPVQAALEAERAGADGIVCHLREDRRHIRDNDVRRLRAAVRTKLDLEMAATPGIIAVALRIRPDLVTLVPEKRRELTTEGGLDAVRRLSSLRAAIGRFHDRGIAVSLFVDPNSAQIDASVEAGADMVELHTGEYANARDVAARRKKLSRIRAMAVYGRSLGLGVNAGHGLDYENIGPVGRIRELDEVSIGHAIIVRALKVGLEESVREMIRLVRHQKRAQ